MIDGFRVWRLIFIIKDYISNVVHSNIRLKSHKMEATGPSPLGRKEIDWLLVPSCKTYALMTDHLITGYQLRSEWFTSIHTYKP